MILKVLGLKKFEFDKGSSLFLRKLIGAIRHPTSEMRHRTSKIRHPTFHIRDSTSDIRHPTSEIRHSTSDIRDLTSYIRHPRFDIRHPTFERMAVKCSAWDQGTYEVRFERKQFWFCLIFSSVCIVANAYYPGMLLH